MFLRSYSYHIFQCLYSKGCLFETLVFSGDTYLRGAYSRGRLIEEMRHAILTLCSVTNCQVQAEVASGMELLGRYGMQHPKILFDSVNFSLIHYRYFCSGSYWVCALSKHLLLPLGSVL